MKEFFALLFFSSSMVLTPVPIDLGSEWLEFIPKKPLKAVTGGAALYLDVTKNVGDIWDTNSHDKKFSIGTIQAELIPENGKSIMLANESAYSISDNTVSMMITSNSEIPTKIKFTKVRLRSSVPLKAVKLTWKNSSL